MIIDLLNFIGDEIKDRNLYFDKYTSIAYQQEDGQVYKFTTAEDRDYCGLSDADGIGFYIKVNPIATFSQGRQLSSTKQVTTGTVECTLVAYQVNSEINILNWQGKLSEALRSIDFSGYTGGERHARIEIKNANNSPEQIFKQETGKDLDTSLKVVAIQYNVIFTSNTFDCGECNIFDTECSTPAADICAQFIARFNNLGGSVKSCILEVISAPCPECPVCPDPVCYESIVDNFSITRNGAQANINWHSVKESNVDSYMIEGRPNGSGAWGFVNFIGPAGVGSNYSYDDAPASFPFEYRLTVSFSDATSQVSIARDIVT